MTAVAPRLVRASRVPAPAGVVVASVVLLALAAAALIPGVLAPFDPFKANISAALDAPSATHWFGTDQSGRDVFSRVVYGARYSLFVGIGATIVALLLGMLIGVASGLAPRVVDSALARVIEIVMAFPEFLVALVVVAIAGPGEVSIIVAVALAAVPAYARVARVQTLVVRRASYVRAATALGVPPWLTVVRHVIPNTLGPLTVMATIGVGTAIVTAAGLSFLGLGPKPPTPEWGVILSEGRNLLGSAWWVAVFPGLVITVTVLATSTVGRYLQSRGAGRRS